MVAESTATVESENPSQQFQRLKTHLHRRMVDAIDLSKAGQMNEAELRQQLRSLAAHLCTLDEVNLSGEHREQRRSGDHG